MAGMSNNQWNTQGGDQNWQPQPSAQEWGGQQAGAQSWNQQDQNQWNQQQAQTGDWNSSQQDWNQQQTQAGDWNGSTAHGATEAGGDWNQQQEQVTGNDWNQPQAQPQASAADWSAQPQASAADWNQNQTGAAGWNQPAAYAQHGAPAQMNQTNSAKQGGGFGALFDFGFAKRTLPSGAGTLYMVVFIAFAAVALFSIIATMTTEYMETTAKVFSILEDLGWFLVWIIFARVFIEGMAALVEHNSKRDDNVN